MFLFDTDVVSALMRRSASEALVQRIARVAPEEQAISAITVGELSYGVARVGRTDLMARVRLVIADMRVLSFDSPAAELYGPLRARLEKRGATVAEADLRIAAIALLHDCVLVTGNVRHFARIDGLRVENWLRA